jgi:hypothetical protein
VIYLRFADLKARGIVGNWQTLQRWIREQGLPAGRMLGPNTRAWSEEEVEGAMAATLTADAITKMVCNLSPFEE